MKYIDGVLSTSLVFLIVASSQAAPNSTQRVRAFAKLPDWSGLWEQYNVGVSGLPATPQDARTELKERTEAPPYNDAWEVRYQALIREQATHAEPVICTFGFPTLMIWSPLMFQAIVMPEETTLIFSQRETRHIYTDGSAHPAKNTLWPTPWGDSIGHWDDQTLIVDTIASSAPLMRFVANGRGILRVFAPFSDQEHFVERIRMLDRNTLEDQITTDDPVAFRHPWSLRRQYRRVPDLTHIVDEDCLGNDRNPIVNGKFTLAPP